MYVSSSCQRRLDCVISSSDLCARDTWSHVGVCSASHTFLWNTKRFWIDVNFFTGERLLGRCRSMYVSNEHTAAPVRSRATLLRAGGYSLYGRDVFSTLRAFCVSNNVLVTRETLLYDQDARFRIKDILFRTVLFSTMQCPGSSSDCALPSAAKHSEVERNICSKTIYLLRAHSVIHKYHLKS